MTDNADNDTDGRARARRREFMVALAATGALGAVGTAGSTGHPNNATFGGGDMADQQSHQTIKLYGGEFDERPDPGVKRRYFHVKDESDDRDGNIYEDNGDSWELLDAGFGTVSAEVSQIEDQLKYADGRMVADRYKTWAWQLPTHLSQLDYADRTKGRISFGWDDTNPPEYEELMPMFWERGIPFGLYANSGRIEDGGTRWGADSESNDDISAAIEMVRKGGEMMNHGMDHENLEGWDEPGDYGFDTEEEFLIKEILEGKRELENLGFNINNFLARGGSGIGHSDDMDSFKSYLIRSTHLCSQDSWRNGGFESFPTPIGLHSGTRENMDGMSEQEIKDAIDAASKEGILIEFYGHASDWEDEDREWDKKMEPVLDYAREKRDNGEIEIATPTGGRLIPGDMDSTNVLQSWDADRYDVGETAKDSTSFGNFHNVPVVDDEGGGFDGGHYWKMGEEIDPTNNGSSVGGLGSSLRLGSEIPHWTVECWARDPSNSGRRLSLRVEFEDNLLRDEDRASVYTIDHDDLTAEWQRYYISFGLTRAEERPRVLIWATHDEIHVDGIKMYPS